MGQCVAESHAYQRGQKKKDRVSTCEEICKVQAPQRTNQRVLQRAADASPYTIQQLLRDDDNGLADANKDDWSMCIDS